MTGAESTAGEQPDLVAIRLAQEIRRLRKAADLSQPDLAAMVGYTRQYVSLAENHHKGLPSAILVQAIDRALGARGALVELRERAAVQRRALRGNGSQGAVPASASVASSADSAPELEGVDTSKRRELIAVAAAVAFGEALDQPALRIIAQADQTAIPATVRAGDVRDLRDATAVLDAGYQQGGGASVRHHALGALRWGIGLLDGSCTPDVRRTLAATVAELAELAAWVTFDAGFTAQARELFLLGLRVAHESGDLGIRAHVAAGLARQEIQTGNPDAALELVQLAHTAADELTPNAVSMLHTIKAHAYAKKPDSNQCHRFVQLAVDHHRPESIGNDPPWLRYFTPVRLNGVTAGAMFDLLITDSPLLGHAEPQRGSDGARADLVSQLANTVDRFPDDHARSKAITAARLATLLYLEHEPAEATTAARTALRLAENVRSARLGRDLRVLARAAGTASRDTLAQTMRTEATMLAATMT